MGGWIRIDAMGGGYRDVRAVRQEHTRMDDGDARARATMTTCVSVDEGAMRTSFPADLLPCNVSYAGPAPVDDYFRITTTDERVDGMDVLDASFRGRRLRGQQLVLPPGHVALLLQQSHKTEDKHVGTEEDAPTKRWEAVGTCHPLRYWNHNVTPTRTDAPRRCMEWLFLAESVSRHVSADEVEKKRAAIP